MRVLASVSATVALLLMSAILAPGQGLTGKLTGTIVDGTGASIRASSVTAVNVETGQSRSATTDDEGYFVFNELLPGRYDVSVSAPGFKKLEQKGISLTANERVTLPQMVLEVGALTETVSVTAEAVRLQTESAERSGLINTRQMQELPLKGRSYLGTAKLLPGITDTANRESPGWNDLVGININGTRAGSINLTLDGVTSLDTGSMTGPYLAPSLDAVAEVKVLTSNYQAEYGRSSGGTINTVIKSGTREFHGGAYHFVRNEVFNANEFFNNAQGRARPRYRFNNPGYFLGGPVILPKFNKNRDKLFFFWSQDFLPLTIPSNIQNQTFPTVAERNGDFSASSAAAIIDPLTRQPFPGKIVPANRIDPNGQKLLSLLPLPNTVVAGNQYNWAGQSINKQPRRDTILRMDYNISQKDLFYVRLIQDYQASKGGYQLLAGLGGNTSWPQLPIAYEIFSRGAVATYIRTITPSQVNEFTIGRNYARQTVEGLDDESFNRNVRSKVGLNIPQFYPQANPFGLIPNATFGGVPNAGTLNIEQRYPFFGINDIWNFSDNYSWIRGKHSMKFGVFIEKTKRDAQRSTAFNGTLNFDLNATNPLDTGYAYSNALLGVVNSYTEANSHPSAHARYYNVEWYAQDTWRVGRRVTIDAGVRFYFVKPTSARGDQLAAFDFATYDASQQPKLVQPAISNGTRVGINPVTGEILPAVKIGTFASGSGTPFQGMKVYNETIMNNPSVATAPRFGLAWDVFGTGKTAIRVGGGIFYDRFSDDQILQLVQSPPIVVTATANFTTINNLLATPLSLSPAGVTTIQRDIDLPAVYNWSFGVQQRLPFGSVLDVAYVGNTQKHLVQTRNINPVAYGSNFLPQNIDQTVAGGRTPLNSNFLRPIQGYTDINLVEFAGIGNYNALQIQLTRRFANRFTYNLSYTWSKAMDLVDGIGGTVSPVLDYRSRNWGRSGFDRTQNFQMNYVYDLPMFSTHWNNRFSRIALDGWEVSGVTAFVTGAPAGIGYSLNYSADLTGGTGNGLDSRVVVVDKVNKPGPQGQWFNVDAIKPPTAQYSLNGTGNANKVLIDQPGIANWDLSLFKNFRLGASEQRRLQFRAEAYNVFNHTQFSNVDTGSRWDAAGNQINTNLGRFTGAALARRLVLGLKLYF